MDMTKLNSKNKGEKNKGKMKKYCMVCISELPESMFCPECFIVRNQWLEN